MGALDDHLVSELSQLTDELNPLRINNIDQRVSKTLSRE
jgi:hypothetical protein